MKRFYYSDSIANFINADSEKILGILARNNEFPLEQTQKEAWIQEIDILKPLLKTYQGSIYFEYSIPRMGQRIDVVLLIGPVVFVLEFKVGERHYPSYAVDQVFDYALDLKNFHETSHNQYIAPVLISTEADPILVNVSVTPQNDKCLFPIYCNTSTLSDAIESVLRFADGKPIDNKEWEDGRYCPTPTIIEAATALYNNHSVEDISRSDASAINLEQTSATISKIIKVSRKTNSKSICFLTGVPGAGKTLVGLNIATTHFDRTNDLYSVFLSGNGPLVAILREALARDKVKRDKAKGLKTKKYEATSEVKMFIQNVHNFRDDCLATSSKPPIEHVALFDEAQRAWNIEQTSDFMRRKKKVADFRFSEPEFLISCLDRHSDWAVIVCLVGGGQEINRGEAGISEWIESLIRSYSNWKVFISPQLHDSEYAAGHVLDSIDGHLQVEYKPELHLSVSMRSFRAEHVSLLAKQILDLQADEARVTLSKVRDKYPIALTRDLGAAKRWLKQQSRGSERYGIVVSSQAERLKPHAIDVKSPMDPIHWFLDGKEDVRSSFYLEDVATEFAVQGLELDWVCVTWDGDFRYSRKGWEHYSFCGSKWKHVKKQESQGYLKNAYRVLLTRARQGMVIVVPKGDREDQTRNPSFYDPTFEYLKGIGLEVLDRNA